MSSAKFTLLGCDSYFRSINQSLFDNLLLPEGLDKGVLTDTILLRGGEFEVQSGNPEFIRMAIGAWSNKWQPTMQRWVDALAIEYNPLENYDRIEDWTDNTARSEATTSNSSDNKTLGRTEETSNAESSSELGTTAGTSSGSSAGSTTENNSETATYSQSDAKHADGDDKLITDRDSYNNPPKHTVTRSAYDSSNYEPLSQETDNGKWSETTSHDSNESSATSSQSASSGSSTGATSEVSSGSTTGSSTSTRNASNAGNTSIDETEGHTMNSDASSAMNNDAVHSGRIHGNIGVTTSQQMLLAELELGYWNIYEKITELFLQEFTIPVYI